MYFTKLRMTGLEAVDLPVVHAKPSDPYILKEADGLGPPEIDVSIINTVNAGGYYQGRRSNLREIVARIGLNPDYGVNQSAADLRQTLYGMLTPGVADYVKTEVMNREDSLLYTVGHVSKLEIVPFSKVPEVQITVPCLYSHWLTATNLYIDPGSKSSPVIDNVGTAPAGFYMELTFTAPQSSWKLTNEAGEIMNVVYNFVAGDTLIIDTRQGPRGIWKSTGGVKTNIIYSLSADSSWFLLHGGLNTFTTSSQAFNWGNVYYLPQYWGV